MPYDDLQIATKEVEFAKNDRIDTLSKGVYHGLAEVLASMQGGNDKQKKGG